MLASVGDAATYREHMYVIMEGLPRDFDSTIALIESRLPHTSQLKRLKDTSLRRSYGFTNRPNSKL